MISVRFRLLVALCIVAGLTIAPRIIVDAQDDEAQTETEEIRDLQAEQRRAAREAALAASEIDVFTANVEEVTEALDELQALSLIHI